MLPPSLRQKLDAQAGSDLVVMTIEEFFTGNAEPASIGCNLSEPPPLETFRRVLTDVRSRPDVQAVLMVLTEDMGEEWPFVDRVMIITSASNEDVASWLTELQADDPYDIAPWPEATAFLPKIADGMRVVGGWWD